MANVDFEFRFKQEKMNAAAKEKRIEDLETKIEKLEELMARMSCDETNDTTNNTIVEGDGQFVI